MSNNVHFPYVISDRPPFPFNFSSGLNINDIVKSFPNISRLLLEHSLSCVFVISLSPWQLVNMAVHGHTFQGICYRDPDCVSAVVVFVSVKTREISVTPHRLVASIMLVPVRWVPSSWLEIPSGKYT